MENYDIVRADFNEIAELGSDPKWNRELSLLRMALRRELKLDDHVSESKTA